MTILTIAATVVGDALAILRFAKGHTIAALIGLILAVSIAISILIAATQGQVGVDINIDLSPTAAAPP